MRRWFLEAESCRSSAAYVTSVPYKFSWSHQPPTISVGTATVVSFGGSERATQNVSYVGCCTKLFQVGTRPSRRFVRESGVPCSRYQS